MGETLQNEKKKEFQLERLILFSDAVFAIAITLLVIEIKIPEIPHLTVTDEKLLDALGTLLPKFIGFLISFMIIGQYWSIHHRMFGFVTNYTDGLIWLNIFFLFGVALMPFSTGFYSEYATSKVNGPAIFYAVNISFLGFINYYMWRYVSKPSRKLSTGLSAPMARFFSARALTVPILFIIFAIVYSFSPAIAFWIPPLIPLILKLLFGSMRKKAIAAQEKQHHH
jgi:uncharacterized membrane protein